MNLVLAFDIDERLDICLDEGVRIVSSFWGDPARFIPRVHTVGGLVLHTAGSASQAKDAVDAGADIIVVQGIEAGGHVCGEVGTMVLVPSVADAVPGTPVVAAGGGRPRNDHGASSRACRGRLQVSGRLPISERAGPFFKGRQNQQGVKPKSNGDQTLGKGS